MKRLSILVLLASVLSACAAAQTTQPAGQTAPPGQTQPVSQTQPSAAGGGDGGGASLVDAARKVTDVCTLLPTDLAAKLVPGASAPQSQTFPPLKCTVSNGTSVLEITVAPFDAVDPLVPNESIAGFPEAAYLQTQFVDDSYLKVLLSKDQGALYVEVAGHDGKDHKNDAIAVAQAVIAQLH
jgi:hypothetical protein